MRQLQKTIIYTSFTFIIIFVVIPVIVHFLPLEFANKSYSSFFDTIRFIGFPVLILASLVINLKKKDAKRTIVIKSGLTIGSAILSLIMLFVLQQPNICIWENKEILFEKKNHQKTKIILQNYRCGETDAFFHNYQVVKVTNVTPCLVWVTNIDTTKIDLQEWNRIIK